MISMISPFKLKHLGVLSMNSRNIEYISRYNPRRLYPIVDNKLNTKKMATANGIIVPELLGVIEGQWQLRGLGSLLAPLEKFVIKPTRGSGGKGILVITGKEDGHYIKPNGQLLSQRDLKRHINNILGGLYSLGGKPDSVMIESLIEYDEVFNHYTFGGVPDLRVIVFKGYPVMAMLRCATESSDGRANLHQGAIGVGIDMASGKCLKAIQHGHPVTVHPDTGQAFASLEIPYWQKILELSASCYEMSGLGYIGCDIVLDKNLGPMILELNARPGLAIQMASGLGLLKRLHRIEELEDEQVKTAEQRVSFSMTSFSEIRK